MLSADELSFRRSQDRVSLYSAAELADLVLEAYVKDERENVRMWVLRMASGGAANAVEPLIQAFRAYRNSERGREHLGCILAELGPDAVPSLCSFAEGQQDSTREDHTANGQLAISALIALRRLGDPRATPTFRRIAQYRAMNIREQGEWGLEGKLFVWLDYFDSVR